MRQRGVHTEPRCTARAEKHAGTQPAELNAAREIGAAEIESAPRYVKPVRRQVPVTTEEAAGALPEIGNHHDLGFIISRAGFYPCLPLAHVVRRSPLCVSVTDRNLQPTEFVAPSEGHHTGDR